MVEDLKGEQPNPVQVTQVTIGSEHIDHYGHVNYKWFPVIFEPGQDAYMEERGIGPDLISEKIGLRGFVRQMVVEYTGQLFEGDKPTLSTSIKGIGKSSYTFYQELRHQDQLIANLELVVVMVDREGRPKQIPDEMRERMLHPSKT